MCSPEMICPAVHSSSQRTASSSSQANIRRCVRSTPCSFNRRSSIPKNYSRAGQLSRVVSAFRNCVDDLVHNGLGCISPNGARAVGGLVGVEFSKVSLDAEPVSRRLTGQGRVTFASATPNLGRRLNRFVNFLRHDEILALLNVQELTRSLSGLLDCPIEFAAGVLRADEGSLGIGPIPWTMLLFVVFIGLRGRAGVIATMIIEAGTMSAATSGAAALEDQDAAGAVGSPPWG